MPPTTTQRLTLRTYALALRLMKLDLAVAQGAAPPPSDAFLLDIRQAKGELGVALQAERAKVRFLARR